MTTLSTLSLILYAAFHTGQSCETVFRESVQRIRPISSETSQMHLQTLSEAACKTSNPDIIWKLAYQESSFRFDIIRINIDDEHKIMTGKKAHEYLENLKQTQEKFNIDIGVMQINWRWHGHRFNYDPTAMIQPERQVRYIMEQLSPSMVKRCAEAWVGCYHHPSDRHRAERYQKMVLDKTEHLATSLLNYMEESFVEMDTDKKRLLPPFRKKDFKQVLQRSLKMLPPEELNISLFEHVLTHFDQQQEMIRQITPIYTG